ncbi:hypothetical protein C8F04DRAFT_1280249 [Mycena alexandri]|uniref:Uncharacterized protein n=1 Tax=Mycena alexandri TaxID=1745969 RepID=A0AAD6RYL9_9AGAR|nr:hypothetical protein C8F04DRAFT_1280249 [Mycena alexandri]
MSLASADADIETLVKELHIHIPALSETACRNIVTTVQKYGYTFFEKLGSLDKSTALKILNIRSTTATYGRFNSRLIPQLKNGLVVILGLDLLFHCSNPNSSSPASNKHLERPQAEEKFYNHFLGKNSWRSVLKKAKAIQDKAAIIATRVDPDLEGRSEQVASRMAAYRNLNNTFEPGSAAEHNLIQVAFFLSALTKGYCKLGDNEVWEVALSGIIAAASVALCVSPLFLLLDVLYSKPTYSPNIALFELWTALGNAHRVNLSHPLGRIERILWNFILSVVTGNTNVSDVPHLFLKHNEVESILKNSDALDPLDYDSALSFLSDLLLSKSMQTLQTLELSDDEEDNGVVEKELTVLDDNQARRESSLLVSPFSLPLASQGAAVHFQPSTTSTVSAQAIEIDEEPGDGADTGTDQDGGGQVGTWTWTAVM